MEEKHPFYTQPWVIITAAVLAVVILAGATIGILFATGVFSAEESEESSSSTEKMSGGGQDNEVDIGDLLGGLS